jgi:tetratricopeptide (TPR) repeat protein
MMNLKKLFIATTLLLGFTSFAQDPDSDKECLRMRFLAGEELKINNYKGAVTYYLKGETICGGYDKPNYDRLIGCLINTIIDEKDETIEKAYKDTILEVYDRAEKAGHVGGESHIRRAQYEMSRTKPNINAADDFFVKGMKHDEGKYDESIITIYYYNLLMVHSANPAAKKPESKKRFVSEFFTLSKVASDRGMSVKTIETLNNYLGYVVKTCDDILPELNGFIKMLPQDKEAKVITVNSFMDLLTKKNCVNSKEYEMLLDTLIVIAPGYDVVVKKAQLLVAKKRFNEAIQAYGEAKTLAPNADAREDVEFEILKMQYAQNNYRTAYNTAMGISGKHRNEALKIAASCVASTANGCGSSTVERKFNFYYASDLMSRAGVGGQYTKNFPTDGELFQDGFSKGQSVRLSCWGVSVMIR